MFSIKLCSGWFAFANDDEPEGVKHHGDEQRKDQNLPDDGVHQTRRQLEYHSDRRKHDLFTPH